MKNKIRYYLNLNGMTQRELSEAIGVSETVMSRYINGKRKMNLDLIIKISDTLCVSIDNLLGTTNSQKTPYKKTLGAITENKKLLTVNERMNLISILSKE